MSKSGQNFIGLLPTQSTRPRAAFFGAAAGSVIIRDQLTITTWLALGALFQGIAFLIAGRYALLPAAAYLAISVVDTIAAAKGWRTNPYMNKVLPKKFSAQMPHSSGEYGSKPADSDVVVFLIGTRCNHPLGLLAPGFKELGGFFTSMAQDLETHAEEFGFLGMTSWINSSDRATKSELMEVGYFRSVEGLHAFAHSKYHTEGWRWWNSTVKQHPHMSIYHETYHVPKGHWENIYVNSHASGMNSTTYRIEDQETGEVKWASPVVDASKGLLKTSAGRMARSHGEDHEKVAVGEDPY